MNVENIAVLFGIFSAVANIVIAVIMSRVRVWDKAGKMDEFMETVRGQNSEIMKEMVHLGTDFRDMRSEYKEFVKNNSIEMREIQSKQFSHEYRLGDIERRLNAPKI